MPSARPPWRPCRSPESGQDQREAGKRAVRLLAERARRIKDAGSCPCGLQPGYALSHVGRSM